MRRYFIFAGSIPALSKKGVYSPEAIEAGDRDSLIKTFQKAGIKIEITEVRK